MYIMRCLLFCGSQKHRVPVHAIPCLEKWLFKELKCELAQKWQKDAGGRKGLLIKLGASNVSIDS